MEATPLQGRIGALEERVDRILAATEPDPAGEGAHLAGVEVALLEALQQCPDAGQGHPVLADAAAWRDRVAESGEASAAERTDRFLARLIESHTEDWKRGLPDSGDPDAWFRALAQARAVDLEAISRRVGPPPLRDELPKLRERFLEAVRTDPPDPDRRQGWVTELSDRADVVLIEAGDAEALPARRRIDRVLADLKWHREEIESAAGRRRARLDRKIWRLRAEGQELDLKERLQQRYGKRRVLLLERLVLWLIVVVLLIFGVELFADLSDRTLLGLRIIDLTACIVFLTEFFLKLGLVRRKRLWFSRHFLVDFVPSIPFAFMVRWLRAIRVVRFLRVVRFVRAFGFATRGIDRVVRRYGRVLNRNIILYPTREERAEGSKLRDDTASRLRRLQARVHERWLTLLANAPPPTRPTVAAQRIEGLERALENGLLQARLSAASGVETTQRDLLADEALFGLASLTPQFIVAEMGPDFVARLARAVRMMAPLRWFFVLRRYIPRVARGMDDAEVVTAAAHKSAAELTRHYDRYFWFADLYGTVTPAQFVDRVGTAMVKGAKRPVVRLILFGLLYLMVQWLLGRGPEGSIVQKIHDGLKNIVGTTLLVLGGVGMAFLAVGWWLRAVAGQATDFFTQSARAAYIGLTEAIKGRAVERDADIFERHVFAPERLVHDDKEGDRDSFVEDVKRWLVKTPVTRTPESGFDPVERAVWIYRDSLDGALLGDNDVHTTAQMLGNPALRNLRLLAERVTRRDTKNLLALDLERQKSLVRGPYLWFSLVCKAIEHGVARLVVEYNRHAIPLIQLPRASDEERAVYDTWSSAAEVAELPNRQLIYVTNDFTAMHFLDADESRDRHVEVRFGAKVLARLQRDRRVLIRRVFGTFPLHKRPRDERVLNLYRVYQSWFAGGRTLLVPLRVFWNWLRFLGRMTGWLVRCVGEIRRPRVSFDAEAAEGADFRTAMRMIRRMRGPIAEMALRMRTRFDPEYLGVRLPGTGESGLEGFGADHDLAFLQATTDLVSEVEGERRRVERDMVRLGRLIRDGLWGRVAAHLGARPEEFGREHLRAAAAAYISDMAKARRFLSAPEILRDGCARARRGRLMPFSFLPRPRLKAAFRRYWKAHQSGDRYARRAAWRATLHNVDGLKDALLAWHTAGDAARERGERILAGLLRHPERITEQLVTLRIVQTLSLIDMLNYRSHVYLLGDYKTSGDEAGESLSLD